ncbi:MAG: hypothetical protein HOV77_06095 [Hamadaea sp.]|uniref:hypothetical protein n=1 Tax=Hamadaea sp. TaxID=2024425 RepID=UPI0017C1091E|nr:hypothetical protein [Hamadaea sp.]NUT18737.1 hypothetical protein [Hamadaea sp.]
MERPFRLWHFGVGHGRLILHSYARTGEPESYSVLFGGVQAMQLHAMAYDPLIIEPADDEKRAEMLAFAAVPDRHHHRMLSLTLPHHRTGAGWILCFFATVFARPHDRNGTDARAFDDARCVQVMKPPGR